MSSEKLMRCEIERGDGSGAGVRYVPLEIFGLWEHLMATRHGLRVRSRSSSMWVEIEDGTSAAGVHSPVEWVTELCLFVFNPEDGMLHRQCRFVPTAELEKVRQILTRHYRAPEAAGAPTPWLRERHGMWFRPRVAPEAVGGPATASR
jgi:hypothetical protein